MEFQFPCFTILFTFLCFIFMVFNILIRSKITKSTSKLPPGPWKLPIIGNLHNFIGSLPHRALRDLSNKYGPLMHLKLGQVSTIVVSSSEFAKEVMKTQDINFASRPQILAAKVLAYDSTNIAFSPYGEYWRQLRKICTLELLSTQRVKSYQPIREEEISNLIKWIASNVGSPINFTQKIFSLTYSITSRAAFGKKCKDQDKFIKVVKESVKIAGGFDIADVFPSLTWLALVFGTRSKLERFHQEVDRILNDIINDHKLKKNEAIKSGDQDKRAEEDLVDVLLKFHDHTDLDFSLTINNIKAVILDVFSAGSDTSATTEDWAMLEMLKNPRVMKKAQNEVREVFNKKGFVGEEAIDELKYVKLVIKETLRLHPPAALLLPRENKERCEINGYEIPMKTKVIINAWAIGRDPKYWAEPERFYPERFVDSDIDYKGTHFEYIPFGAGRRICPGINFGLINAELPLAYLLYHFDWKLPNEAKIEDLNMIETFGATVRRQEELYLIPIVYYPLPKQKSQV